MTNYHASLVILDDRGVLITGPSGSGKTMLALRLLSHGTAQRRFARLVADDQVFLEASGGRLIGRAPATIAGLAEARGCGPAPIEYEKAAVIDLVVQLVPANLAPRYRQTESIRLEGIELPILQLPERDAESALFAIAAHLALPPFGLSSAKNT